MDEKNLMAYIKRIYQLESSLYHQKMLHRRLTNYVKRLTNAPEIPLEADYHEPHSSLLGCILFGVVAGGIIGAILGIPVSILFGAYEELTDGTNIYWAGQEPYNLSRCVPKYFPKIVIDAIVIGAILGIISYIKQLAREKKNAKIISQKNQIIVTENQKNRDVASQKALIVKCEINALNSRIAATTRVLDTYYRQNVIFPKYWHDFVAISSFYEYLASGRTKQLEVSNTGADVGAYNLYEKELRQNLIIAKLDDIIRRLDDISTNQRMLYDAIQEGNRKVDQMSSQIMRMSDSLKSIENNSAISAYNSQITAQNTEYIKWIEYFSSIKK